MADQRTIDIFHEALNFGSQLLGAGDLKLKEKQYEVLKSVVIDNKDVWAVLPTGYGKSLIHQLLAPIYNFMDFAGSPGDKKSMIIVISPLNALIRDQIVKMREDGLNVSVLRGDRVDTEDASDDHDVSLDVPVEILSSSHFDLIYTHSEVLVDNKKVSKLLKTPAFIINIC
ncbi:putative ATP-dependent DNA helicase Q1 [Acropora millepora]|uniref:putative ATP-dependent DNA helicase Q1 n=1 Tax=Acropora millepora TaxID=45264 RepID=UPI001CF30C60|nr:putative ATP-dependent DNA helicase Q1 [Acropora millepora]